MGRGRSGRSEVHTEDPQSRGRAVRIGGRWAECGGLRNKGEVIILPRR